MASNLKVDIVKPTATNGSLSLKGDSGGSATTNGVTVDSSGNTAITGTTTISTADINGGTIDGTTIGASSAAAGSFTQVNADNIRLDGNTISSTDTNGDINLTPDGTGKVVTSKADINGGAIDGTTIGGTTPAAGSFTSVNATSASLDGAVTINDSGADVDFRVESDTNENALFVKGSSGNVGIGTSPTHPLHIKSNTPGVRLEESDGTSTHNSSLIVQNLDNLTIQTRDSSGTYIATDYQITKGASGPTGHTWNIAGSSAMSIDSSGNVGIGTDSPTVKLDVNGNLAITGSQRTLRFDKNDGSSDNALYYDNSNSDNTLSIGRDSSILSFRTASNECMRIESSGNILVGTQDDNFNTGLSGVRIKQDGRIICRSSSENFFIKEGTGTLQEFRYASSDTATTSTTVGEITITTNSTAYVTSSDYRLKEDWRPMSGSIDRLKALKPVNFAWKSDGSRVDGFLAHEAQEIVPESVTGEKDAVDADGNPEYQGIDQAKLVPLLTAALQEAVAKIESLEARIAELEAR